MLGSGARAFLTNQPEVEVLLGRLDTIAVGSA